MKSDWETLGDEFCDAEKVCVSDCDWLGVDVGVAVTLLCVGVAVAEALALEVADCCPRAAAGHARGTRKVSATSPTPRPEPVRPSSSRIAHLI
jgi:hypothetical protein